MTISPNAYQKEAYRAHECLALKVTALNIAKCPSDKGAALHLVLARRSCPAKHRPFPEKKRVPPRSPPRFRCHLHRQDRADGTVQWANLTCTMSSLLHLNKFVGLLLLLSFARVRCGCRCSRKVVDVQSTRALGSLWIRGKVTSRGRHD